MDGNDTNNNNDIMGSLNYISYDYQYLFIT